MILIKDKEMPNVCAYCFLDASECDLYPKVNIWRERHPDCPLTELPPHGDLVDRNKLLRRAKKESTHAWKMNLHARTETILNQFIDWLDEAETVIEAEGSKT